MFIQQQQPKKKKHRLLGKLILGKRILQQLTCHDCVHLCRVSMSSLNWSQITRVHVTESEQLH